jgi:putative membrane protein
MPVRIALLVVTSLLVDPALAHGTVEAADQTPLPTLFSGLLLIAIWLTYFIGARRVQPSTGRWLIYQGASLIAALAILDSLNGWIENGSAMHMVQHMLIMVVITPLFVLAQPLSQWLSATGRAGAWLWKFMLRLARYPLRAGCLQGVVLWFWHAPKFYNLALEYPWLHLFEHVSIALGAGIFWWSVLARRTATALFSILFTLMHTGMLGALLTFSRKSIYGDSINLEDQQLSGMIMWVPASLPYLIAGCWCSMRWFQKNMRTNYPEL